MLEWLESFFPIIGKKLVDYGVESVRSIRDFKSTLVNLERNLHLLRAKASDVEEQIKNAQLSGKKKRKREVENWLEEVKIVGEEVLELPNEEGFVKRFFSGNRAGKLNERVDGLLQQSKTFGELVLDDNEAKGDPLLAAELIGKSSDDNLEKIWKLMVVDKVRSVGIYGMGGVGKTTLAKQINNRLLKETQYNVYWVTVSQAFTIRGLQDGIAKQMCLRLSDEENEDRRAAILNRGLSQRKDLVLILDDVWEDISLEKLGDPLQVEGCRLIITSRSKKVCHRIGCQEVILVKTLDKNEAWNLFRKTLNSETELDPQVEEIARRMARKCAGLPLGIIVLAGSMRGVTNIHVWRNSLVELEESLIEQTEMDDKVFGVLRFSFDRLDPNYQTEGSKNGYTNLQLCFLYCSLYPEDYSIPKEGLIERLISEKLMSRRNTKGKEFDQGHAILDKLVSVCLLQEPDFQDTTSVSMHDLVRCMALKIASVNPRFMVSAGLALEEIPNEEEWTEDLDKVSLMENKISELPAGISPNCPKLTTLLLNGNNRLKSIPESFFLRMSGLQVLNLSSTGIKELPHSLSDLERLNTLLLRGCGNLVSVPYLGKLKVLEELDLSFTKIKQVPEGMENLVNLRYLCWFGFSEFEMFPTGLLSKYHHLQKLGLSAQVQAPVNDVGNLKKLEQFFGRFGAIGDLNQFTRSRQSQGSIRFYGIDVGVMPQGYGYGWMHNHRKVIMHGCSLSREEYEDDMILLPEDIEELEFFKCEGLSSCLLDDLARVNIPRSLKGLTIKKCEGIECISNEQSIMSLEEDDEPAYSFHSLLLTLVCINLSSLPNFTCIYGIGSFSSLKSLYISECNKIKKLGLRGADIQNLEEITIDDCAEIEEIIQVEEDDRSRVEGVSLPKLKKLNLKMLPRLNCICKAKMVCSSIEQIEIYGCQNIKKMPLSVPSGSTVPPAPLKIYILPDDKEWWQSVEWEHPIQHELKDEYL